MSTKKRYLITCTTKEELETTAGLLPGNKLPHLSSSKGKKMDIPQGAGSVNQKIRVISVALTPGERKKMAKSHARVFEEDIFAFACILPTQVEAAVKDYPYPWGVKKIDADIVWPKTQGEGVRVAVLDTGVDAGHPNLHGNIKKGAVFVENVSSDHDDNGHGTHCAGIVAARIPAGKRSSKLISGVAPKASIVPVKVLNYNGQGLLSGILGGLEWCLHNKISIISMSLRIPYSSNSFALKQACKILWDHGILLVAAVGNDQEERKGSKGKQDWVGFPAKYDCVIGVGATDQMDTIAPFSNVGPGVDLVAPGVNILSTYRGKRYRELSGTSQACPHVAGVAALLKSYRKKLSNEEIKKVLLETADPLGGVGPDITYGRGLLNATGAIEQIDTILG